MPFLKLVPSKPVIRLLPAQAAERLVDLAVAFFMDCPDRMAHAVRFGVRGVHDRGPAQIERDLNDIDPKNRYEVVMQ